MRTARLRSATGSQIARVKFGLALLVRAVAASPRTLHGARPSVIVSDELTQWRSPGRMYAALRTSLGNGRLAQPHCWLHRDALR